MNKVDEQGTTDEKLNANDVGRQFLVQYYNAMAQNVDDVARTLYSDASVVKRFGNEPVSGIESICKELSQHHQHNKFKVRILNTICINSLANSIVMQVAGEYVQENSEARAFIQNVVLASQGPRKYYIHSDMIEWLDDLYPKAEPKKPEVKKSEVEKVEKVEAPPPQINGNSTSTQSAPKVVNARSYIDRRPLPSKRNSLADSDHTPVVQFGGESAPLKRDQPAYMYRKPKPHFNGHPNFNPSNKPTDSFRNNKPKTPFNNGHPAFNNKRDPPVDSYRNKPKPQFNGHNNAHPPANNKRDPPVAADSYDKSDAQKPKSHLDWNVVAQKHK